MNIVKAPFIPVEKASELLDLLLDSKKYAERMEKLVETLNLINERAAKYDEKESIDTMREAAVSKVTESEIKLKELEIALANRKKEADQVLTDANNFKVVVHSNAQKTSMELTNREKKLAQREKELVTREKQLAEGQRVTQKLYDESNIAMNQALELEKNYHEKLNKMKELAA
jgi:hypothetical protein